MYSALKDCKQQWPRLKALLAPLSRVSLPLVFRFQMPVERNMSEGHGSAKSWVAIMF